MMDLIFSLGRSEIICANSVNFAIGSSRVWSLTTKVVIFCLSDYFLFTFFRFYLGQYWERAQKRKVGQSPHPSSGRCCGAPMQVSRRRMWRGNGSGHRMAILAVRPSSAATTYMPRARPETSVLPATARRRVMPSSEYTVKRSAPTTYSTSPS